MPSIACVNLAWINGAQFGAVVDESCNLPAKGLKAHARNSAMGTENSRVDPGSPAGSILSLGTIQTNCLSLFSRSLRLRLPEICLSQVMQRSCCVTSMENTYARVMAMDYPIGADLALNPNSRQQEFALRDLDGYFLIVSEFQSY